MEAQMQGPKKKGKKGILIAAILVLVVAGMAVWGGQSDWFQGALKRVPQSKVTKVVKEQIRVQPKDVEMDEPVLTVIPDKSPVELLRPIRVAKVKDLSAPISAVGGAQDQVVYRFKVDRDGGLLEATRLGFEVDAVTLDATNLDLMLWESKDGIKTEVGLISTDLMLPSEFSYDVNAEYLVTADLSLDLIDKTLDVALLDLSGNVFTDSEKSLEVVTAELIN